MKPETLEILRARWQRLRIYRYRGSVLVDYRILRNFVRIIIQQEQPNEPRKHREIPLRQVDAY